MIRCVTISPVVLGAEFAPASSRTLTDDCGFLLDLPALLKTSESSPSSSKTYEKLSLITRFVNHLETSFDVDEDIRWHYKWQFTSKDAI